MYPIMTSPGSGAERLEHSLEALCELIDRPRSLQPRLPE